MTHLLTISTDHEVKLCDSRLWRADIRPALKPEKPVTCPKCLAIRPDLAN